MPRLARCNPGPYLLVRPASAESTSGEGSITMRQFRTKLVVPAVAIAATAGAVIAAGCGGPTTTAAPEAAGPAPVVTEQVMPGMSMLPAGTPLAASGQDTPGATNAVAIQNFAFSPAIVTIKTGTTVTWTNRDQDSHTATAMSGPFHSPTLNTGQLYLNGYRTIPGIGPAFLLQASGSLAIALLLVFSSAALLRLAAALAAGALMGFIASRTIGVLGFVEYGLQPVPQALISVLVEIAALALLAVPLRDRTTRPALSPSH